MKKLYTLFVILFVANFAIGQTAFIEKFQSGTMPTTFTLINDNNTVATNIATIFAAGPWVVHAEPADTNNKVAASPSWFTAVAPADRWMITPAITVATGMTLSWGGKAQDPAYKDGYTVKISTTGKNKADFTTTAFTIGAETETWSFRNYSLSAFAGQTIYVAFIQNSTDMFYIMIDDIRVGVGTGVEESTTVTSSVSVTPNPADDQIRIIATSAIKNVKVVNTLGQVVINEVVNATDTRLDISALNAGIYFVTSETEEGIFTEKIVVQ